MIDEMDGRFYADGRVVKRASRKSATGISMGFRICEIDEWIHDDNAAWLAAAIADALNAKAQTGELT